VRTQFAFRVLWKSWGCWDVVADSEQIRETVAMGVVGRSSDLLGDHGANSELIVSKLKRRETAPCPPVLWCFP
jgi:hypothetical protein